MRAHHFLSLKQMFIGFTDFPTGDRDDLAQFSRFPVLALLPVEQVQGGHGRVEMELQRFVTTRLAIVESEKRLGIAEQKLHLKTRLVVAH
jgi:hypothetical protein